MRAEFKASMMKAWGITDDYLIYGNDNIPYSELTSKLNLVTTPTTSLTNGVIQCRKGTKILNLAFKHADKERAHLAVEFANNKIDELNGVKKDYKYVLIAHTGTKLEVYEDYVILYFMQTGSLMTNIARGGALGGKKINYADMTAIQFKEPAGITVGFIQFVYPGSVESKGGITNMINDENSIPFQPQDLDLAKEIVAYMEQRKEAVKTENTATVIQQTSAADEIKKFKELLDSGIISQEEFEAKKKQLLGL